jgi:hypothetical protein
MVTVPVATSSPEGGPEMTTSIKGLESSVSDTTAVYTAVNFGF